MTSLFLFSFRTMAPIKSILIATLLQFLIVLQTVPQASLTKPPSEQLQNTYCTNADLIPPDEMFSCQSCSKRCGHGRGITKDLSLVYCSCRVTCIIYGDCCEDFSDVCPQQYKKSQQLLEHFQYSQTECSSVPILEKRSAMTNYTFVSLCGQTGEKCRKANVTDLLQPNLAIPVVDVSTGLHYINYQCALCNNAINILPWNPNLKCLSSEIDTIAKNKTFSVDTPQKLSHFLDKCKVRYTIPTKFSMSPGCIAGEKTCPHTCNNTFLVDRCKNSYTIGYRRSLNSKEYINYYCALCAGEFESDLQCIFNKFIPGLEGSSGKPGVRQFSLSILFDFNPAEGITVGRKACPARHKWVDRLQSCHLVSCPSDFRFIGGKCLQNDLQIAHNASVTFNQTDDLHIMAQYLSRENDSIVDRIHIKMQKVLTEDEKVLLTLGSVKGMELNHLLIILNSHFTFNNNSVFNMNSDLDDFSHNITLLLKNELVLLIHKSGINLASVKIEIDDNVAFSQALLSSCTWIKVSEEDYHLKDDILVMTATGANYTNDKYRLVGSDALVCIPKTSSSSDIYLNISPALGTLTIVLTSLSIVCLTIRLVLQFKITYYDSFAGRLQFNLFLALCLAYLVLLIGGVVSMFEVKPLCKALAMLQYWFFLAAFSWMAGVTFDAWLVFRPKASFIKMNNEKSIIKYVLICWLIPASLTIIVSAMDSVTIPDVRFKPGFGEAICWFNQRYALLTYFGVPVALITMTITIFFIITIIHLRNTLKDSIKPSSSDKGLHQLPIYLRLFILMGVSWIFGFVAAFAGHDALWIIFIILNASQGILVFVSFVLNRKVLRELQLCSKKSTHFGSEVVTNSTALTLSSSASDPPTVTNRKDSLKTTSI